MTETAQQKLNRYWSTHAPAYDENQTARQRRDGAAEVWASVWQPALPSPPARVLDIGTGSGNVALLLAELGHDVTAIDLASGMLAEARRKGTEAEASPVFLEADAVEPPFDAESFDAITARYLLWTLREPERALANWRALLRPGGRLVLVDSLWYPTGVATAHDGPDRTDRDRDFRSAYDDDTLRLLPVAEATDIDAMTRLVAGAGFADVRCDPLEQVRDLDRRYGVAPGHRVQLQYRISARRD